MKDRNLILNIKTEESAVATVQCFNFLESLFIQLSLIIVLIFQYFLHDLPCPLCLLQRLGFFGITFGLLLNLRYGFHPRNYSISLFCALFTGAVALFQIGLHVIPGTGSYGKTFLGLHLYTWSFIFSVIIIATLSFFMGIERQYEKRINKKLNNHWSTHALFAISAILLVMNIMLLLLQCGWGDCPET